MASADEQPKRARLATKAEIVCRFQDERGRVLLGQPSAYAADTGAPIEVQLLANQDLLGDLTLVEELVPVKKLLAPLDPVAIICIGLNYAKHAAESGMKVPSNPVVFMKTISTLQHPFEPIYLPKIESQVDWEVELTVVIGKRCRDVSEDDALSYVAGYTVANDVSGREWQLSKGGGQWCFGKSFDTFTPLGPVLATPSAIPDPQKLRVKTTIDGEVMQDACTDDMIFSVAKIISFLSQGTTLLPGTVILTGTPFGVGLGLRPQRWLKQGETVTVEIDNIGKLTNPVQAAP
eukprot:gb/GFBE01042135.1/.p1 GENE.gb/GFBE01042135.1/~~gb/GFBE01042135.1/.p1  ORF type:complete len:291 (+),score=66.06 gb/GFBE01042135.1/:1-873(+)